MKRKLWLVWVMVLIASFMLSACSSSDDESSAKAITAYSIAGATGVINESAKTITVNMPFGTSVTSMVATFTTTGRKVEVGSVIQVSGTTPNNFTSPVGYKVTAEDGSSVTYTVTVIVAPSTAKAITNFSIGSNDGVINETAKTIAVNVLWGKDLSELVATFSTTGTGVKVGTETQTSGTTANNFSSPVVYTVTAADASTQNYTVTVTANLGGSWTQQVDFGKTATTDGIAREEAVGFGVLSTGKGYMGTGWNGTTYYKDFWEYDSATNTWTQKDDFAGGERKSAVAFAIGTKGYVGTGEDSTGLKNDFWEYDTATNTWKKIADFAGTARTEAVGFSSKTKGYLGTGEDTAGYTKDFYEYDPATDTWTKKADFIGVARAAAVGLFIGDKGYIGTGTDGTSYYKDFYEYNPAKNEWVRKADFGGTARMSAVALYCLCSNGYVGLGYVPCTDCPPPCPCGSDGYCFSDFWEYDSASDKWTQKAYFDGGEIAGKRARAVGFSISVDKHFVGTGWDCKTTNGYYKDFWKYTP